MCKEDNYFYTEPEPKNEKDDWGNLDTRKGKQYDEEPKFEDTKLSLIFNQFKYAEELADKAMKATNGHSFVTILKTRCQFCNRSPKAKGKCGAWFQTFLFQLDRVLLNKEYLIKGAKT